jgi:hypothetical protein
MRAEECGNKKYCESPLCFERIESCQTFCGVHEAESQHRTKCMKYERDLVEKALDLCLVYSASAVCVTTPLHLPNRAWFELQGYKISEKPPEDLRTSFHVSPFHESSDQQTWITYQTPKLSQEDRREKQISSR